MDEAKQSNFFTIIIRTTSNYFTYKKIGRKQHEWAKGPSPNYYRTASLSKLYLRVTGIIRLD